VELDFDLGVHRYRVVRGLTSAELYLDGSPAPIANGINAVTELLRKRLGMTREEFFNTYFTGQKELSVMAAMGPAERAQFLSRVLGYERLRSAQELLRRRRSVIAGELAGVKQGMPDPDAVRRALDDAQARLAETRELARRAGGRRREAERALADVAPRWEAAQRDRERHLALQAELRVAEGEEAALLRDRERLAREGGEVAAARAELAALETELAPLPELSAEFHRLEALAREEGRRLALGDQRRVLEPELASLRERLARLEGAPAMEAELGAEAETRRAELAATDAALEARRAEWTRDQQEAETKRDHLRRQYVELKQQFEQLEAAGPDGSCPTCTRPLRESYASVMELLSEQMETVRVDGRYYKDRLEQLRAMPDDLAELEERRRALYQATTQLDRKVARVQAARGELAQLQGDVGEKARRLEALARDLAAIPAGYDPARHDEVRALVRKLAAVDQQAAVLRMRIAREPALAAESERLARAQAALGERLADMRAQRDAAPFSERAHDELREAHRRAADAVRAAELQAVQAERDAAAAGDALATAEAAARELAERQRLLDDLARRKRLHDELDRAYTDLRGDLNADLRPELSELASRLLGEITDGRYSDLEIDDAYDIIVQDEGTPKPVISGGEEDLANLVLRLAISQMIAERAGQPLSLLILDEIFGSLDEVRRANVVDLLRRLQDRFEQVILITHIDSVREGLDRVVVVRYDEATRSSRVEQQDGGAEAGEPEPAPWPTEAGAAD
jgi:exonuclease SbcC